METGPKVQIREELKRQADRWRQSQRQKLERGWRENEQMETESKAERKPSKQTGRPAARQTWTVGGGGGSNNVTFLTSNSNVEDTLGKVALSVSCRGRREQVEVLLPYPRHQDVIGQHDVQLVSFAILGLQVQFDVYRFAVRVHVQHYQVMRTVHEVGNCARKYNNNNNNTGN